MLPPRGSRLRHGLILSTVPLLLVQLQLLCGSPTPAAVPPGGATPDEVAAAVGKGALVTGAAGFIGSHVAQHCLDLGMRVVALDDLSGGFMVNVPLGAIFVKGDVKDAMLLERVFAEHKIDYVYHLGAYAAEGLSHFIRSFNYRTNLVGSVELLNQAIKHRISCFVFTSSIAVYGSINDLSQMQNANRSLSTSGHKPKTKAEAKGLTETDKPTPEDPYGIAKYAFELDLHAAKELFGMDFVIFRPHNVYGPHQNMFDKYRNVVGIFINQIAHGKPLTVFGDGEQVRAFSYIDDVAPVISRGPLVAKARNEIFNVGADKPYTINELARAITHAQGKEGYPINYQPARLEVEIAVSNHDKVKAYFGTPEGVPLGEGLRKTVAWYKTQGRLFKPVEFSSVEVVHRMPPSWVRPDLRERAVCEGSRVEDEAMTALNLGDGADGPVQEEAQVPDEDLAFWVAAFREVNLMPGALRSIRQFYKKAPILITVDGGGASAEFREVCKRYGCVVLESNFWMGTPHSSGGNVTGHNFTCSGYLLRFESILNFAPSARFLVVYEPDTRMFSPLRVPAGEQDIYQYANMENPFPADIREDLHALEGFPRGYSLAGGSFMRRSALSRMLENIPAMNAFIQKHSKLHTSKLLSQETCLYMLSGLSKLRLNVSPDVMQSTSHCDMRRPSPNPHLIACYRCIHSCKVREDCYQRVSMSDPFPPFLRGLVKSIYFKVMDLRGIWCPVMSEACSCHSGEAVRRVRTCIRSCSYTCPSMIHNLKGRTASEGAFADCVAAEAAEPTEL